MNNEQSEKMLSVEQDDHDEFVKSLLPYLTKSMNNAVRAMKLAIFYSTLKGNPEFATDPAIDDILRASVVFAHATLEDFLRTYAAILLPSANEIVLDQIPLSGSSFSGRAEKFYLGKLLKHRGKTVDKVIEESVVDFLKYSNFNDVNEIVQLLRNIKVDTKNIQHLFPAIEELMQRRHLIVHRADMDDESGVLRNIDIHDVSRWLDAIMNMISTITIDIFNTGENDITSIPVEQ